MTKKDNSILLFHEKQVRRHWHENQWYFSVIDIVSALTNSTNPRDYWYKMKI
jgi:prophage antirepressor-like protein